MKDRIAIVGGGFAGTLLAINLLRYEGPRATLVERRAEAGKGLAYGSAHPSHLLNVRAANMSAFPDEPDHFVRWLAARGRPDGGGAFVPRLVYGEYLQDLLTAARETAGDRLELIAGDAVDIVDAANGLAVRLVDGRSVEAGGAVLAVGNLPPHLPPGIDPARLSPVRYVGDPWTPGAGEGLGDGDTVMIVGAGLTMIDVALMLDAQGFGGRILALSRRGLVPRAHAAPVPSDSPMAERPTLSPANLLAAVRRRAATIGWRNAVDELRPFTQAIWAQARHDERGRFIRHLRPWWDVHRHRLSPEVAKRVEALRRSGRLVVAAGKIVDVEDGDLGATVTWRPRGGDEPRRDVVQRIVNCTGPQGDLMRTTEPLLGELARRGVLCADAEHLGIDVDGTARVIGATGRPDNRLHAIGPMTRGAFWEVVAVPDIRRQAWDLARRLANAHWVGGEGL